MGFGCRIDAVFGGLLSELSAVHAGGGRGQGATGVMGSKGCIFL